MILKELALLSEIAADAEAIPQSVDSRTHTTVSNSTQPPGTICRLGGAGRDESKVARLSAGRSCRQAHLQLHPLRRNVLQKNRSIFGMATHIRLVVSRRASWGR